MHHVHDWYVYESSTLWPRFSTVRMSKRPKFPRYHIASRTGPLGHTGTVPWKSQTMLSINSRPCPPVNSRPCPQKVVKNLVVLNPTHQLTVRIFLGSFPGDHVSRFWELVPKPTVLQNSTVNSIHNSVPVLNKGILCFSSHRFNPPNYCTFTFFELSNITNLYRSRLILQNSCYPSLRSPFEEFPDYG